MTYSKFIEKLIKMSYKLTSIQLSSTIHTLEEFILDLKMLVKVSSLITSQKEKNFSNSTEITIELISTLMLTRKHLKKLNKLKEKLVKLPKVLKMLNKT